MTKDRNSLVYVEARSLPPPYFIATVIIAVFTIVIVIAAINSKDVEPAPPDSPIDEPADYDIDPTFAEQREKMIEQRAVYEHNLACHQQSMQDLQSYPVEEHAQKAFAEAIIYVQKQISLNKVTIADLTKKIDAEPPKILVRIPCSECKDKVSIYDATCPYCGAPITP